MVALSANGDLNTLLAKRKLKEQRAYLVGVNQDLIPVIIPQHMAHRLQPRLIRLDAHADLELEHGKSLRNRVLKHLLISPEDALVGFTEPSLAGQCRVAESSVFRLRAATIMSKMVGTTWLMPASQPESEPYRDGGIGLGTGPLCSRKFG